MRMLYLVLSLCVSQVYSMALKGPVLTRYQPCGLGVIYFDKITDMLWRAEINLELYQNLEEVEIVIIFEKEMALYGVSHNSTVFINNQSHNFTFIPNEGVPDKYHIYTSVKENTTASVPIVKSFSLNGMIMCNDFLKAADTINSLDTTQPDDREYRHTCGRRSLSHTEVSYVRTEFAQPGDWPWHVAILIKKPFTDLADYQCGGNVISRTAILTAGHCVFLNDKLVETSSIIVEAGVTNLKAFDQVGKQTRFAERIILHPGYSMDQATSDLAIVVVNKLRYTEYVQPICVWGPVYDKTALFGKQAVITGFGTTEQNIQSDTLRSTNTMVQNDTTCNAYAPDLYPTLLNEFTFCVGFGPNAVAQMVGTTRLRLRGGEAGAVTGSIHPSLHRSPIVTMIRATGPACNWIEIRTIISRRIYCGINPRNGDSGGGLYVPTKQADHKVSWFLRGILSKCGHPSGQIFCDPKYYVIYTDVGPHYGWIYHHAGLIFSSNILS